MGGANDLDVHAHRRAVELGKRVGAEVRFIEYMDVGGATGWKMAEVVTRDEMLAMLSRHFGTIVPLAPPTSATTEDSASVTSDGETSDGETLVPEAIGPDGVYGKWLRTLPVAVIIDDEHARIPGHRLFLFLHQKRHQFRHPKFLYLH